MLNKLIIAGFVVAGVVIGIKGARDMVDEIVDDIENSDGEEAEAKAKDVDEALKNPVKNFDKIKRMAEKSSKKLFKNVKRLANIISAYFTVAFIKDYIIPKSTVITITNIFKSREIKYTSNIFFSATKTVTRKLFGGTTVNVVRKFNIPGIIVTVLSSAAACFTFV